MNSIRNYIERQVLITFTASEILLSSSVLGIDLAEHADLIAKSSFSLLFSYYLSLFILLITFFIPISAGVAHYVTFTFLKKRGEVTGLFASGFTTWDLLRCTGRLRIVLTIIAFFFIEVIVPPAAEKVIGFTAHTQSIKIQESRPGIFFARDALIFAGKVKYEKNVMENVTIISGYSKNMPDVIISADKAFISPGSVEIPRGIEIGTGETVKKLLLFSELKDIFAGHAGFFSSFASTSYELISALSSYSPGEIMGSRYTGFIVLRIILLIAVLSLSYSGALASLISGTFEDRSTATTLLIFAVSISGFLISLGITVSAISLPEKLRMPLWIVAVVITVYLRKSVTMAIPSKERVPF